MEKFLLLILCSSFYSIRATDCTENSPPCSDVHDIATITCGEVGESCIIKCGPGLDDCTGDINAGLLGEEGNIIQKIDAGICKEKCREQATAVADAGASDPKCEFYRWEEKKEGKCILQTICGEPDMTCQHDDFPDRCMTGQIGCTEDGTPSCRLDNPVEYSPDTFHLICHGDHEDTNIYSDGDIVDIPTGTECYTIHMCAAWEDIVDDNDEDTPLPTYYRKLAVICSADGKWEPMAGKTGSDVKSADMVKIENKIEEPTCSTECGDLVTIDTNLEPEGTELICDTPLIGGNLQNGNSCILICDNHWTMSITCLFQKDGTKDWMDQNWDVVTPEKLSCNI